jgi:hypothetical protein
MGIARLFTQTVSVQTYQGVGPLGPVRAAAVDVACYVNDARKLVRNSTGDEVISETTLYAPLSTYATFTIQSLVTVNGRTASVLTVYKRDSAGPASAHHVEVTLS